MTSLEMISLTPINTRSGKSRSRPYIAPALFLLLHQLDDSRRNDRGVGQHGDRALLLLLHVFLGVGAGGELDIAGERHALQLLDPVLYRRRVGAQHMQARTVGDNVHANVL